MSTLIPVAGFVRDIIHRDPQYTILNFPEGHSIAYEIDSIEIMMHGRRFTRETIMYIQIERPLEVTLKKVKNSYQDVEMIKLGSGTFGTVYSKSDWDYVVKVLSDFPSFVHEAATYEILKTVYGKCKTEVNLPIYEKMGFCCIAIPKCDAEMSVYDTSTSVKRGIANAIYNLHRLGIIHRDIKHSNVMVTRKVPCLVDFGLTTFYPFTATRGWETSIQTIWYRAPEVVFQTEGYTPQIDNWSFGVILASKGKHLMTPKDVDEVKVSLQKMFKEKSDLHLVDQTPLIDYGEAQGFLNSYSEARETVSHYLGKPEIRPLDVFRNVPISDAIGKLPRNQVQDIFRDSSSFVEFFAGLDFYTLTKHDYSLALAEILYGNTYNEDESKLFQVMEKLDFKLYRLNTFMILTLLFGKQIREFVLPCLRIAFEGNQFPHNYQADWIAKKFLGNSIYSTNPFSSELEVIYSKSLPPEEDYFDALMNLLVVPE
jgi:serine/threonine protein kinase